MSGPGYETKLSDSECPVLKLWVWSTPSFSWLQDQLWQVVIVPIRVPSTGKRICKSFNPFYTILETINCV